MNSELNLPKGKKLFRSGDLKALDSMCIQNSIPLNIEKEIEALVTQKEYPCVAAIKSYFNDEYEVGLYKDFGSGNSGKNLRQDLQGFLEKLKVSQSPYYTFWGIFPDKKYVESEEKFETDLWNELSHMTSEETKDLDWQGKTTNPNDKNFGFHLFGENFFVVGLHPEASRKSRKFPWPTLIFNVFSQFQTLRDKSLYDPMVETNRKRDVKFQGDANPMALIHGDDWETIQFSGRKNSSQWKCPFSFMKGLLR